MRKNLKAASIETGINLSFKKRLYTINKKRDFDFNSSLGTVDYLKRRIQKSQDNTLYSNKTFISKKNYPYITSISKSNIENLLKTNNSHFKRRNIEEEKTSSYIVNSNKKNGIEGYKEFGYSYSKDKNEKIKDTKFKQSNYSKIKENKIKNYRIIKKKEKNNLTEFPKYEKTMDNKMVLLNKKNETKKENIVDDEWNIEQYKGFRKKTMHISRLKNNLNKANKLNKINSEFSTNTYVKLCKATSVAGKSENGLKKINQDSYILERNINGILNFNIFGVLDGHGINGHLVSQFVCRYIINRIKNHNIIKNLKIPKEIYHILKANGYEIVANIFTDADAQLKKQKFNVERSGTTCVLVIELEEHIICANAGDSRGIVVFDDSNNNNLTDTKIYPLSFDCKPENPYERQRIYENGGTVEQIYNEDGKGVGPFRVWIKGQDYPGLAMSRSIGDMEAKTIGVIPNPQIIEYEINQRSKYMIICSDGIWEFISNEEAMKIGNKYYLRNDPLGLCQELTNKSTNIWIKEDIVIDDITVVVVFF